MIRKGIKPARTILSLAIVFLLSACAGAATTGPASGSKASGTTVAVPGGAYTNVTPVELQTMLANKDFVLVNTHIPFEGNLPSTDRSIPYNEIGQKLNQLPTDKNAKIVLYCRSGRMSDIAARTLVQEGYTNVWNLNGGMIAWEQAGLKLEK